MRIVLLIAAYLAVYYLCGVIFSICLEVLMNKNPKKPYVFDISARVISISLWPILLLMVIVAYITGWIFAVGNLIKQIRNNRR